MTCQSPLSFEDLSRYWAESLPPNELDRIEEHLLGCAACSGESARVSALVQALRAFIPPVVSRAQVEELAARGLNISENSFDPGHDHSVTFLRDFDVMIHRLKGFDLGNIERLRLTLRSESTGEVMFEDPNVPFDPRDGVLIACQRHYSSMPPDTVFELRARDTSGAERTAVYGIMHVFA